MSNRHTEIADAVVAAINAAEIAPFGAVRKAKPGTKREELETVAVQVIPSTFAYESADRSRKRYHYGIDVGIQQAVEPDNLPDVDARHDWLPQICALFEMQRLPGLTVAAWEKTETMAGAEAGYATEHFDTQRVFTGVLRFVFMVIE